MIGRDIIAFDKRWASIVASPPKSFDDPRELAKAYLQIAEFAQGFMTQYQPSMITGTAAHQGFATGYPIGRRFRSAKVTRVADGVAVDIGHQARAAGACMPLPTRRRLAGHRRYRR